jgi:hypothetical protein|tara:strand:- start:1639 stop:2910 length:1272 start_codon:yes stop_codon:yes gene_type:complete
MVRRELGEGRWDKVLMRRMVNLSVADNYDEAKEEWLATGSVWWRGNGEIPEWVSNSQQGEGSCLCGHRITYHFEILNTENGIRECVGSDHINSYLIMRQIAQEKGQSIETITEEQIKEWINVRVGSMKAEAWWAENGESFEMMFNKIKEIDVRYNTRAGNRNNYYYDREINEYVYPRKLRKKSEGEFGTRHYKMASIVWRWNHPDNPKNQQTTRGYPNERLMRDLALYFVQSEPLIKKMKEEKERREIKKAEVAEKRRIEEERRRLRNLRSGLNQRFRQMQNILNVPFQKLNSVEQQRERAIRDAERKVIAQRRAAEKEIADNEMLAGTSESFEDMCGFYGIPVFDETFANNEWEREFLVSIKYQLTDQKELTSRQLNTCKQIFDESPATEKQIKYLKALGYDGEVPSKRWASKKISELKGDE